MTSKTASKTIDHFFVIQNDVRWTVHFRTADRRITAMQACPPGFDYRVLGNGEFVSRGDTPQALELTLFKMGYAL